ncbi:MAG: sulfatase [Actinomycetes bacterium]
MKQHAAPPRRRALTAVTAILTVVGTVASVGLITTLTPGSSAASTTVVGADPSPFASPVAVGSPADPTPAPTATSTSASTPAAPSGTLADVKNVVFILADDLDWALFDRVPRLAALKQDGMTFTNNTVTDSLCCPSRTSILRSQYLHNHHVVSNIEATGGGWQTFKKLGEQRDCLPVWLKAGGIRTGLFGKFLNGYSEKARGKASIPPGWDEWAVPASGADTYTGYNYVLNDNGRWRSYGKRQSDFLNDVITNRSLGFIRSSGDGFFAELASFNPHRPSPVAVRNSGTHLLEIAPRTPNYNTVGQNEPTWLRKLPPMPVKAQVTGDIQWRQRLQSAESVADSIDAVRAELNATGKAANTLIVVTADNGYHQGNHRMRGGKRTAYREDTVVPLVVIGPGVQPGATVNAMTSTVDLAPTFAELLRSPAPAWVDGRSLVPILSSGQVPGDWRTGSLSESMGRSTPKDPDYQPDAPPRFSSLRTPQWLFVVYRDGERELYDLAADPYELNNIVSTADPAIVAALNSQLQALRACQGPGCRVADSLPVPPPPSAAPVAESASPAAS